MPNVAVAEARAPLDARLAAPLVARDAREGHCTPTNLSDASSNQVLAQCVEVAQVSRLVDQLARRDPLLEQLGRAAVANAPDREREAAHAVARNAIVFEAARLAGERDDRTPRPLIDWADACDDLLGEPILIVGALGALRRHELPDVARHPMDGKRHCESSPLRANSRKIRHSGNETHT